MARPLRIEYPGALYHVTARSSGRAEVFRDDGDREAFLATLGGIVGRLGWLCHAYCLMDDHYHLLVETPEANLSRGMRQLNGVYTQHFNRAHGRTGNVFQGRFKAVLVEKEAYLLELCRYMVLNPVRAGLVRAAKDWRWSSYRATAGKAPAPAFLTTDWVLARCPGDGGPRRAYRRFVAAGRGATPWQDRRHQIYLGSDAFVEAVTKALAPGAKSRKIPRPQRRRPAKALADYAATAPDRDEAIRAAWASGTYTLTEIATHFSLHYSRISRISRIARGKGKM